MISAFVSMTLAAVLGQAPAEAAWLKSIPADVDVAIHIRGLGPVKDDISGMLKAMSPTAEQIVSPILEQGLMQIRQQVTEKILPSDSPIISVLKLPKPGDLQSPKGPPFATFGRIGDYAALQKTASGFQGDVKIKSEPGGYDSITGKDPQGQTGTVYSYKGNGFVALSNDDSLIKSIAKPTGKTLDSKLTGESARSFFAGDIGLFGDLEAVQTQFGDQIAEFRKSLPEQLAQGNAQGANSAQVKSSLEQLDKVLAVLKNGRGLALHFDFAPGGLTVSGFASVKEGTSTGTQLAKAKGGPGALIESLPADAGLYSDSSADPGVFLQLQRANLQVLGGAGDDLVKAMDKAIETQLAAKIHETATAVKMDAGTRVVAVANVDDSKKFIDGALAVVGALKGKTGAGNVVKGSEITRNAETYQGISFDRTTVTIDLDKFASLQPNAPGGKDALKDVYGGGVTTTWIGAKGNRVIAVSAKSWDEAKGLIDTVLSGKSGLGAVKSFQAIRGRFPKDVGTLFLFNLQGVLRVFANTLAAAGGAAVKLPANLPAEPALFGGAVTGSAGGYQFQFVVPSNVGPVIEQGLMPLLQGAQGRVAQ